MNPRGGLSIMEALDNLNALVDAETLDEIEVTDEARLIPHIIEDEESPREIYWVRAGSDSQTLDVVKLTLRTVYEYLQSYYHKMHKAGDTKQLVDGVSTIMVLVGEAAKKLDRFGALFQQKVTDFPEYKELQNFYKSHVIRESFREFAKAPIHVEKEGVLPEQVEWEKELQELLQEEEEVEEVAGVHILNDIDLIKRDHLYELFYLKNEAGHDFYSLDLARHIKLACDFGEYSEEYFGEDPLLQIKNWEDRELHQLAKTILKAVKRPLEKFYEAAMRHKGVEGVILLHNACMSLMLAANPRNLIRQFALKGCHLYFADFLLHFRAALQNREYEKLVIYGPPTGKPFFNHYLDLVHAICYQLFTSTHDQEELRNAMRHLIERVEPKKAHTLSDSLMHANHALTENLKLHPNGPVFKALDIVREDGERTFDPLMQGNLPTFEWTLKQNEREIHILRLPSPTVQQWINHAEISEEFKTFLRAFKPEEHLLVLNFQERTSWKEHARVAVLEELGHHAEFADQLTVVTLATETDFYNQIGVYQDLGEAKAFIEQLADHLEDESTGYSFPAKVKKELFPNFISRLLEQIHKAFFEQKNTLSYLERLDFIELAYHFIELKLIELIRPTLLAFTSKDALDIGAEMSIELLALLTIGRGKSLDFEKVQTLLFGPTLMQRERVIHPERFDRLYALVRLLESSGDYLSSFGELFRKQTLEWEVG